MNIDLSTPSRITNVAIKQLGKAGCRHTVVCGLRASGERLGIGQAERAEAVIAK